MLLKPEGIFNFTIPPWQLWVPQPPLRFHSITTGLRRIYHVDELLNDKGQCDDQWVAFVSNWSLQLVVVAA